MNKGDQVHYRPAEGADTQPALVAKVLSDGGANLCVLQEDGTPYAVQGARPFYDATACCHYFVPGHRLKPKEEQTAMLQSAHLKAPPKAPEPPRKQR